MNDILFLTKIVTHENCALTNSVCEEGLQSRQFSAQTMGRRGQLRSPLTTN
jgi:hypothetical protein